ncbi:MAG: hypothetical protein EXS05_13910 [Planctomycetaceae bacterium]|nr:hypothetical protein [Planctomycetaceae bacterium]
MPASPTHVSERRDWQGAGWFAIPSWMISLVFHVALLATFALTMQTPARLGDPDADEREVGLYFKAAPDAAGDHAGDATDAAAASNSVSRLATDDDLRIDDVPPVELTLPEMSSARLGPGTRAPLESNESDASELVKSTGPPSSAGKGDGGTSFFGQQANGARFVYVLDASGSMADHNALKVAKAELLASLAQLEGTQQFQIIFYSQKCYPMVNAGGQAQMFPATDTNRTLASQFIRAIQPLEGTQHLDAVMRALDENPDVIYFLTDAGAPILDASDLDKIKRRNRGRTRIHAIEFGKHANLSRIDNNFLQKLARDNGGGYVYRDITKFGKK